MTREEELEAVYARMDDLEREDGQRTEAYLRLEERAWEIEAAWG